jgi:ATP-dependent Clp protease adaptor protein ClpS
MPVPPEAAMPDPNVKTRTKTKTKTARPPLYKVILLNDDYTPREFVVQVLKAVFRMGVERAQAVMMTAHRRGACVIAVYTRDVAETKRRRPPISASRTAIRCSSPPSRKPDPPVRPANSAAHHIALLTTSRRSQDLAAHIVARQAVPETGCDPARWH